MRRISELREQCALEQQAKAHLEENLRSDLEEKDNLIAVLNTKVRSLFIHSIVFLIILLFGLLLGEAIEVGDANNELRRYSSRLEYISR